jgi:cation diffusion facilitator CzcD-associated flavoprotein CzcO
MPVEKPLNIAIIGAGPSGIAAGHELLKQGFSHFTIYDALDAPGGTWRLHSYPGLACDVWAHSYSFSYAPNPDWTASFVEQPEIQAYLARCAQEFGLDEHLRLNTRITTARYREAGHWLLESESGEQFEADIVINAMGNQHTPLYPDVPGMDSFSGDSWHGTRWNHNVDLSGKRVAVVGSAACAVQVVPEVAKVAGHLTVLQRSANWIMPRNRKVYSERKRGWFRRLPLLIKLTKWVQRLMMGQVHYAATLGHARMGQFEKIARKYIEETIPDPELREALTPDSRYGCKRGLVSDDFYPALMRDNVELVAEGLERVTPSGLVTSEGREIEVDVIIYCTGYRIMDYDRIEVVGASGGSLAEAMGDEPRAYKGIAVPDFPNYFFAVGPNGLVLNVSYFITAERNIETIVGLLSRMRAQGSGRIEVKKALFKEYNDWMDERFPRFSWGAADCNSYYTNASGHAPFLFPGSFKEYKKLQAGSGLHEYETA